MSHTEHEIDHDKGAMQSYVVGFMLSLAFTFLPYFLVSNHIFTGTALLVTILGFAILQMIVQVTFFLHLGRGPKPNWNLYFFGATIGIILFIVAGSIMIINNLHYNMAPSDQTKKLIADEAIYQIGGEKTGACEGQHANHKVTITNGEITPNYTVANKCDTLTFISNDSSRDITFGTDADKKTYNGESEVNIRKNRNETITLSESGSFQFHDRLYPDTLGYFTVGQ